MGIGFQTFFHNKSEFTPTIELTGDIYLENDKVLRLNPDGSFPDNDNTVRGMINVFAGSSFRPAKGIYLAISAGPGFIGGQTFLAIKPSVGFYFSATQKWMGKLSYINVFNRTKLIHEDFGSLSFSIGFKLF